MLLLIDYSSLLYRAFFSVPDTVPMHGVHGFLAMLARLVLDLRPRRLAIAVDEDWRPAFRTAVLPCYKAHRVATDDEPDPVAPQEALGRELLAALGVAVVGAPGFEAEDVIATMTARTRGRVEIVSGDRDLFALVRDPRVRVRYPQKGVRELLTVDEAEITRRYGIPGRAYLDFALLRGDPSDGLPGVAGIGEKTAAALIREHGSLTQLLGASTLPAPIARRMDAAARAYLDAARRVIPPVATVPLTMPAATLPRAASSPRTVSRIAAAHRLQGQIDRLREAFDEVSRRTGPRA